MPIVDCVRKVTVSRSTRARQIQALFDIPDCSEQQTKWTGEVPLAAREWSIGLIVGPSGAGKSTVAKELFPGPLAADLAYDGAAVIDDFAQDLSVNDIAEACSSVGFNTMTAWLRPFHVLSNGEKFRVDLARRIAELPDPVVVDEFSSVIDRQVAKIASHALAKYVRRKKRQFVAVSCHSDIIDWLQPDWVLEPVGMQFHWRSLQRRPAVDVTICRVSYEAWHLFSPFHYLTNTLNRGARCYCAFVDGRPVAIVGVIHYPHPKIGNLKRLSRVVTHPDWQGLGIAFHLMDAVSAAYKAMGFVVHINPAHPAFIRSLDRSRSWQLRSKPGASMNVGKAKNLTAFRRGICTGRPAATFRYAGPAMERGDAQRLLASA